MEKLDILQNRLAAISPLDNITADQAKDAIIALLDFLEEKIESDKVDEFLNNLEQRLEDDRFGIFAAVFSALKGRHMAKRL